MKLMNRVTVNSLIGAMCRITEPASTHGQQNLTVRSIEKRLPWTDGRKLEAEQIAQRCDCLHRQLKKGRNKRLAHNDLNTILADTGFPLPPKIAKEVIDSWSASLSSHTRSPDHPWAASSWVVRETCGTSRKLWAIRYSTNVLSRIRDYLKI